MCLSSRPACKSFWRPLLGVAAMMLLAVGTTSCDRAGGGPGVVTLRFWNGFTGPDGRTMLALVRQFNEANPDVHVIMQRMDWDTYYNKLFVAGMGGRGPEVFVSHTDTLGRLMRGRFIRPVDDLTGPDGLDADDFDENVWAAVERDGQHYAIPLDIHLLGMYYNRTLLREAGVVDDAGEAKPPTNREEFLDALDRLQRHARETGQPGHWSFVFTWLRTNVYTMMRQFNGGIFNDDRSAVTLTDAANVEALAFCADLVRDGYAPSPENFESWVGFLQGRVGIAFEGIYMLPELERQRDLDFAAAPLPMLGDEPAAWAGSHNLCIRADLEDDELDAAGRFLKFLSDHSLDWAEGGQIPVRKSLRDTDRFREMEAQRAFAEQIPYAAYLPQVSFTFEYQTEFDLAVERALRGRTSPEAALAAAAEKIERVMERHQEHVPEDVASNAEAP